MLMQHLGRQRRIARLFGGLEFNWLIEKLLVNILALAILLLVSLGCENRPKLSHNEQGYGVLG